MTINEHKWIYCEHCNHQTVICGGCGNNCCNGGGDCERCDSAYELEVSDKGCPEEFILRAKRTHEIQSMSVDEVKKELEKSLTSLEVELLLGQIEHLTKI